MIPTSLSLVKYFTLLFATVMPVPRWNTLEAGDAAIRALAERHQKPNSPFCKTPGCSLKHEVLGEYELPYKTHRAYLIVTASKDPQRKCQTCGPALSFLEFTVSRQMWRVTHSDFAVTEWGQAGEPFDDGITVDALGYDVPAIFAARRGTDKDGSRTTTEIYARLAGGFRLVASIPTGYRENAGTAWEAEISTDPTQGPIWDLVVESSGTEGGRTFSKRERYHFNGSKYELSPRTPMPAAAPGVARWDSVGARRQVLAALETQSKKPNDPICEIQASGVPGQTPEPGYKCSLQHQVLSESDLPYKTRRAKVVIAGSWDQGHNCDGCGVSLSFFEFTVGQRRWQLAHSDFGVGEWGQDGKPNSLPITVGTLGDEVVCVNADVGSTHQGISGTTTDIYARLGQGFRHVGGIPTYYDNSSLTQGGEVATTWYANWTLDPHPARLHDLIVKTAGTDCGASSKPGCRFSRTERYHFNGQEYVLVEQ
ncbi:MAG TPA: hypothetical protein VKU01_10125 [Bryobacteraceae bacterium]|nr:hypothetical protein [Bryobacteraceae bacterium]